MRNSFLFSSILLFIFPFKIYSQEKTCKEIFEINDSLFSIASKNGYNLDQQYGNAIRNVRWDQVKDISDLINFKNNTISFRISYGCGCGHTTWKLVTDGKPYTSDKGLYYKIKLFFRSDDHCEALCHENVCFDVTPLLEKSSVQVYFKFENFENPIFEKK